MINMVKTDNKIHKTMIRSAEYHEGAIVLGIVVAIKKFLYRKVKFYERNTRRHFVLRDRKFVQ